MKVDFGKTLTAINGTAMTSETGGPATLGDVCVNALLAANPEEKNVTGKEKFERWSLAKLVNAKTETEVSVEQVSKIKELVGKYFAPSAVGPVFELLEGN